MLSVKCGSFSCSWPCVFDPVCHCAALWSVRRCSASLSVTFARSWLLRAGAVLPNILSVFQNPPHESRSGMKKLLLRRSSCAAVQMISQGRNQCSSYRALSDPGLLMLSVWWEREEGKSIAGSRAKHRSGDILGWNNSSRKSFGLLRVTLFFWWRRVRCLWNGFISTAWIILLEVS